MYREEKKYKAQRERKKEKKKWVCSSSIYIGVVRARARIFEGDEKQSRAGTRAAAAAAAENTCVYVCVWVYAGGGRRLLSLERAWKAGKGYREKRCTLYTEGCGNAICTIYISAGSSLSLFLTHRVNRLTCLYIYIRVRVSCTPRVPPRRFDLSAKLQTIIFTNDWFSFTAWILPAIYMCIYTYCLIL